MSFECDGPERADAIPAVHTAGFDIGQQGPVVLAEPRRMSEFHIVSVSYALPEAWHLALTFV